MTESEVIQVVRQHFESFFPKVCPNCSRRFETLREYIRLTKRVGRPLSYDAELGDWKTRQPIGTVAMVNCPCGNTLALTTDGMMISKRLALLDWMRIETHRQGVSPAELLDHLRDMVRRQVLDDDGGGDRL
ncbi:MAG TPA: hypothetical protein VMH30_06940 [Verrucomicrobiae bacterium]|nr:hypothetical protein [Verrucomicrobiae bacterium]